VKGNTKSRHLSKRVVKYSNSIRINPRKKRKKKTTVLTGEKNSNLQLKKLDPNVTLNNRANKNRVLEG